MKKLFLKSFRLRSQADFKAVHHGALSIKTKAFRLQVKANEHETPRIGIIIPRRRVKLAVARNRLKRIIRESFRHERKRLPNVDIVMLLRQGGEKLSNPELFECLDDAWNKLSARPAGH